MTDENNSTIDDRDFNDELENKLHQLSSMLTIIHGCGYESFNQWSDQVKDNYLWSCSTVADEARQLFRQTASTRNFNHD